MNNRLGWTRICGEDLSEFHRDLIKAIPKYASIAVSEGMLPKDRDVLALEERALLPNREAGKPAAAHADVIVLNEDEKAAIQKAFADNLARSQPTIIRHAPRKARNWQVDFPAVTGEEGDIKYLQARPQCLFRADKLRATDSLAGEGTVILDMFVGQRLQWPSGTTIPTHKMMNDWFSHQFDTCEPVFFITLKIRFLKKCEFSAILQGRAVL
jgi:hypothetical protein